MTEYEYEVTIKVIRTYQTTTTAKNKMEAKRKAEKEFDLKAENTESEETQVTALVNSRKKTYSYDLSSINTSRVTRQCVLCGGYFHTSDMTKSKNNKSWYCKKCYKAIHNLGSK